MNHQAAVMPLLHEARQRHSQSYLATRLGVSAKTISRWEKGETAWPAMLEPALREILRVEAVPARQTDHSFTFIDLFAGIGGIRLGFEASGGKCVFTSEWDPYAQKTYGANFPDDHEITGDITGVNEHDVPRADVLLAGFPCQPFSIAGVSKKNSLGRAHGFMCKTQGTLFFDVARIIDVMRPKAFMLENVKNLISHDKGNTFRVILATLENELKYKVHYKVIDAAHFVPQHRERIIIAGFREDTGFDWSALNLPERSLQTLSNILHPQDGTEQAEEPYTWGKRAMVSPKYTLTDNLWRYLQDYAAKHKAAGNGFGFGLVGPDDIARTLSARYYKDGSEILINQGVRKNPRRLTPRECARLMGYPDSYRIPVSDTQAYRQFGNSVAVPVMREVARIMVPHVLEIGRREQEGIVQQELFIA
jgi:DNA (cytosine-5)-methyltransferase 1